MQLLVISDTHGRYDVLCQVVYAHLDADIIVHCGDGEYEIAQFLADHPHLKTKFIQVRGNCDYDSNIPSTAVIPLPYGHQAVVAHGHTLMHGDLHKNLIQLAKDSEADIVLFGHLHARHDHFDEGIHIFNPGSAVQPRDQFPPGFGLIDVLEDGILTSHGNLVLSKRSNPLYNYHTY
ncbi:MAG: YfcE family phosphodiesterase [Oscillospiraceae bacterium]|nr:YfcE family phosphodiesterase [Oscillospiraceae bacterium]